MFRSSLALALCAFALIAVTGNAAQAAPGSESSDSCFEITNTSGLRTAAITRDLGLTGDQVRELRGRLSHGVSGFEGFDGLGLTPAQIAEMQRRIDAQVAEMNRHPLGWPCKPFKNPSLTLKSLRNDLLANGFRTRGLSIRLTSPRQIQFQGIQDGITMFGVAAKTGPRQLGVTMQSVSPRTGDSYTLQLPFEA